jgi:hypothetical protein
MGSKRKWWKRKRDPLDRALDPKRQVEERDCIFEQTMKKIENLEDDGE